MLQNAYLLAEVGSDTAENEPVADAYMHHPLLIINSALGTERCGRVPRRARARAVRVARAAAARDGAEVRHGLEGEPRGALPADVDAVDVGREELRVP